MAYRRRFNRSASKKRKSNYSSAELIAFRLGQEQRVRNSLKSGNKDSRVYDAFCKGYNGKPKSVKKSLY